MIIVIRLLNFFLKLDFHITLILEDQLQRKAKKSEKDVIAWSRPGENLAEKEEYTWVPARYYSNNTGIGYWT